MCRERHAGLTERSTTRDVRDNATKTVELKRCAVIGVAKPFHDFSWHARAAPTYGLRRWTQVSLAIDSLPSKFKIIGCEGRAFRVDLLLGDTNPWAVVEITVCSTMEPFSGSLLLCKGKK